ncbi:molybdenum ABC transporter ATP-binding protein [Rhodobium gokarnense]|uniref:Molybdate transport system ATP-binding protein n=1 Tax=Rhodobium gokarnense TaxID=364296 RepID=A0ABT3H943_9HYPH|nr:molybdenum ABC transporter ATP-binding protein [Rhodobium gokarnense]MCW2306874.1 molybdate transport system ATP-binding protein [Rhodobium gokarnense]
MTLSDTDTPPEIEARFRGRRGAFDLDVSFSFPARGMTALFGPSGCGKTTILRCIAGLERMEEGRLVVNGAVWQGDKTFVPTHKRPIGYVFQEASLFAHLSVRENLLFGKRRTRATRAGLDLDEVVRLLGLTELLGRSPLRLSGGERQRVAIGRAILATPEILLMDEPLAALDRFAKNEILPYLERLHEELAIPVLFVTHDLLEAERLADRMVLMDRGTVRANGPIGDLLADPSLPLARMPEATAVLAGKVTDIDEAYGLSTLLVSGAEFLIPGNLGPVGSVRRLRIAASDVGLTRSRASGGSSILNGPVARITDVQPMGEFQMTVFLKIGPGGRGAPLLARITRKSWDTLGLEVGDLVHALIKSAALAKE